jgi:hypothetical protein
LLRHLQAAREHFAGSGETVLVNDYVHGLRGCQPLVFCHTLHKFLPFTTPIEKLLSKLVLNIAKKGKEGKR